MKISLLACLLFVSLPASALSPTSSNKLIVPHQSGSNANPKSIDRPILVRTNACASGLDLPANPIGEQVDELTFGVMLAARESGFIVEIVEEEVCRRL